jgi:branched-chain amino acid aminotransferase
MRANVWLDGDVVAWERALTSVLSHGVQRGAAVFDVGALRGNLLFRPKEHIARFLRSAELVGLQVRWDAETLLAATLRTARASGATSALVRWTALVPHLEPDVVPGATTRASVAIAVITADDSGQPGQTNSPKPATVRVAVPRDVRKAGPEVFPPQAKVGASYLGPMLAKRRAMAEGYDEVVLLDREGLVAEAPTANVFAVKDGKLVTPPLDRVLAGITRDSVLALARAEGIEAREAHLSHEELVTADEAFLAGTSLPVQGIVSVDGRPLRDGAPGPVTARLKAALVACELGEDPRFSSWVVPVSD